MAEEREWDTAKAKLKDGRVITYRVPKGTSPEQAKALLLQKLQQQQQPQREAPGFFQNLNLQAQAGAADMAYGALQRGAEGVATLLENPMRSGNLPASTERRAEQAQGRLMSGFIGPEGQDVSLPEHLRGFSEYLAEDLRRKEREAGIDIGAEAHPISSGIARGIGQTAALPIPGMAQGALSARVGSASAIGALGGYLQPTQKGEDPRQNAVMGLLFAGGLSGVNEFFSPVFRKMINAKNGQFKGGDEIKKLIEEADKRGIPIFSDDIMGHPFIRMASRASEEIPLVGTSAGRSKQAITQREAIEDFLTGLRAGLPRVGDDFDLLQQQSESLVRRFSRRVATRNKLWERATKLAGDQRISLDRMKSQATRELSDHLSQQLGIDRTSAMAMVRPVISGRQNPDRLLALAQKTAGVDETLVENLVRLGRAPSVNFTGATKGLKSDINRALSTGTQDGRAVISDTSVPYLMRVKEALEEDIAQFAEGKPGLSRAYQKANNFSSRMAQEAKKTVLKDLINERGLLEPEKVYTALKSGKISRNQIIYQNMDFQGRQAVKYSIVKQAFDDAVDKQGNFVVTRFNKALKNREASVGVFFRGADADEIKGLSRVLQTTEASARQFGEGVGINFMGRQILTGAPTHKVRDYVAATIGGGGAVGAATIGVGPAVGGVAGLAAGIGTPAYITRLFMQTQKGRNYLLALGKQTPGTREFQETMQKAVRYLSQQGALLTQDRSADEEGQ